MKIFISFKILFFFLIFVTNVFAKNSDSFNEGKNLFLNKKYDKSKFFFEKDLVFNPKNSKSYLYLAKIYKEKENVDQQEHYLQNVLLLDPKNDEAIYMLINLKIKQSDYDEADDLIKKFELVKGFFKETLACTTENFSQTLSKEEIMEQLKQNTIGCKNVNFKIFGFSLAAINTIFSIFLSAIFIKILINYEKN